MTITSHFPEESGSVSKNTAGSNVLGFLGGLAIGLLPILIVVLSFISTFYSGVSVSFESSQSLLFLSSILVVAGSIFAIVKRKFGLGLGVLVGFFGGSSSDNYSCISFDGLCHQLSVVGSHYHLK